MPETVSPFRSVAPSGGAEPMRTSATSRSSTGVPFFAVSTMLPKSCGGHGAARAEQRVLLGGVLDIAAAEVGVVFLHARGDVVKRQAVLIEQRGIDHDLILLGLAAPGVDFADAGKRAQLRLDHPFVQILEFHGAHGPGERVLIEFAERGGRQPQHRLNAARAAWRRSAAAARLTSWRAKYMATESSNTTVTIESPSFESDRTSSLFGRPSIARSIG